MDIMINISTANATAGTYAASVQSITDMKTNLKTCIDNLGDSWIGEAKNNFTLEKFPKLLINMKSNIDMLDVLQKEIALAVDDFNALDAELKSNFGVK